ncbi:MAG TPA: YpdA family putative bacillithiol disulfide reductase [Gemmatimonadaceae bacterium]|nr:YpdA family putative bacillithiol disulfide reductase [Gemmatimonadaceae bacterium]
MIDVAIVGAGPCGLAAAISCQRADLTATVFDTECVVSTITQYPTYATFFSTAEKLSLGGLPFVIATAKPSRRDALAYYRSVVTHFGIDVRQYERVTKIERSDPGFVLTTQSRGVPQHPVRARHVIVATGYFGSPNLLGVPGEDAPHVSHRYIEGHHAFAQPVVVVGGGNSAAEAALDLWRSGAHVTLTHFGPTYDKKIKPWVLPDLNNRIAEGSIRVRWNARVTSIGPDCVEVRDTQNGAAESLPARHVYLLTGYAPNVDLLRATGVAIDGRTGIPAHDPRTLETDVPGVFIAGVVTAGYDANKVFIENGRFHGDKIVARILGAPPPETPGVSRDLDS